MTTGQRMKLRRKELSLSAEEIANVLGLSPATVYRYENGSIDKVPGDRLVPIANALQTTPAYLMGWDDDASSTLTPAPHIPGAFIPKFKKIPLLGTIACGEPILAEENIEGYIDCEEHVHASFALHCKGDSMVNARINDGDVVFIREQPEVENGQIAAVLIGEEATLKRVYFQGDSVMLSPENPRYTPMVYTKERMNEIKILGKAVAFLSFL